MWGGTLLSSGLCLYINVVGVTSLPSFLWMLLLGSLTVSLSGVLVFVAAQRLEGCTKLLDQAPRGVTEADIIILWERVLERDGGKIFALLAAGLSSLAAGGILLTWRLILI